MSSDSADMTEFFEFEHQGKVLFLRLRRDVGVDDHPALVDELNGLACSAEPPARLLLDLSHLTFVSAHVLGALLRIHKRVRESDGMFSLCLHAKANEMFTACHIDRVLDVRASADQLFADP